MEREELKRSGSLTATTNLDSASEAEAEDAILSGVRLIRCEDEPVSAPGEIQGFGLLFVMDFDLGIQQISNNTLPILGIPCERLLRASFLDFLADRFNRKSFDEVRQKVLKEPFGVNPRVFRLSLKFPQEGGAVDSKDEAGSDRANRTIQFYAALHKIKRGHGEKTYEERDKSEHLLIMELELCDDALHPRVPPSPSSSGTSSVLTADVPESVASSQIMETSSFTAPTTEGSSTLFLPSITSHIDKGKEPLFNICIDKSEPQDSSDFFRLMNQLNSRLGAVTDMDTCVQLIAKIFKKITPFDRVMVYEFDEDWNGKVVAECRDPSIATQSYFDLHFPASDIPKNVRTLYKASKLQCLYARDEAPAKIVGIHNDGILNPIPVDMSFAYLRAMSPVYLKFLRNMTRVLDLLTLFQADFAILSIDDTVKLLGSTDSSIEILSLLNFFRRKQLRGVVYSRCISQDFPDYEFLKRRDHISGFLHIPLSEEGEKDFLKFFRKEEIEYIKWAGNPNEQHVVPHPEKEGTYRLEPRRSFQPWEEVLKGRSKTWTQTQLESAALLHLLYGRFIFVWRQREKAIRESRLKNLLLAHVSHEVRTPLNAMTNYLELALESGLTSRFAAHWLGTQLSQRIKDLTRMEAGKMFVHQSPFNIHNVIQDAVKPYATDAARRRLEFSLLGVETFPEMVLGDEAKFQHIISNLCKTSMNLTREGYVRVTCSVADSKDDMVACQVEFEDTSEGIPQEQLEVILEPGSERPGVGLGLAVVSRIIKTMKGELKIESEVNKGSRFTVKLDFKLPDTVGLAPTSVAEGSSSAGKIEIQRSLYILVAEDNPINRDIMQNRLVKRNHRVALANNGEEAVTMFLHQGHDFDVVLMDSQMPLCDGVTATRRIRQIESDSSLEQGHCRRTDSGTFVEKPDPEPPPSGSPFTETPPPPSATTPSAKKIVTITHHIPIIAVSGSDDPDHITQYREAGMNGFLRKPVDFVKVDKLLRGINNLRARVQFPSGEVMEGWFR
ncbi:Light-sensor Protein kinase [Quaeritorhiza haematococci]|nr:Light-sensor Protein kinase [Quaeritorhiza haematococci]